MFKLKVRPATLKDNTELLQLQARCHQGRDFAVSLNTAPDFFQRAGFYEKSQTFVVVCNGKIRGCASFGIKQNWLKGKRLYTGHAFQVCVDKEFRRKGLAELLNKQGEAFFSSNKVYIVTGLAKADNRAAKKFTDMLGTDFVAGLKIRCFPVFSKKIPEQSNTGARTLTPSDMKSVTQLINQTWQGYHFFKPVSPKTIFSRFTQYSGCDMGSFFVLEREGRIVACMAVRGSRQALKMKIHKLSLKMQLKGKILKLLQPVFKHPDPIKKGDTITYAPLTFIGYETTKDFKDLLLYVRNRCAEMGVNQLALITQKNHETLKETKRVLHIDSGMNLYIKLFKGRIDISGPIFVDGTDI